jgi:hypothetical protein
LQRLSAFDRRTKPSTHLVREKIWYVPTIDHNEYYVENASTTYDLVRNSLPAQGQLILLAAEETTDGIVFRVRAKHPPCCPACSQSRVSYHSRYVRRMRDLPWQGRPVEIHLQTRRFRCRNQECARKIFAECLPAL